MLVVKFLLLLLSTLLGYFGGYFFTEVLDIDRYKVFQFKAFQCRPCLSFHISWVISTIFALAFLDWDMAIVGVGFALMLWIGLKIDQRNKTVDDVDKFLKERKR